MLAAPPPYRRGPSRRRVPAHQRLLVVQRDRQRGDGFRRTSCPARRPRYAAAEPALFSCVALEDRIPRNPRYGTMKRLVDGILRELSPRFDVVPRRSAVGK